MLACASPSADCPYVCRHIIAGEHEARNYLAMELLGDSLSDLRRRQPEGKLSMATTALIGVQVRRVDVHGATPMYVYSGYLCPQIVLGSLLGLLHLAGFCLKWDSSC